MIELERVTIRVLFMLEARGLLSFIAHTLRQRTREPAACLGTQLCIRHPSGLRPVCHSCPSRGVSFLYTGFLRSESFSPRGDARFTSPVAALLSALGSVWGSGGAR
jgi:hypothetical protein